jgi:hypothetical protein
MSEYGYEKNAVKRFTGLEVAIIYSKKHVGNNERIVVRWWLEVFEWT